ncbi:MAG TPA: hypothetical protein VJ978_03910 [Nitriliruptoraceae bacterium]|nr:hypothetical protein [Nitriliruptoraceae bacterium]
MESDPSRSDDHARWQGSAMGHVMGGLDADESSAFRRHLLGCPTCKAQVRELRDLAGTLQLAARDEQSVQAIRIAARTAADGDHEATPEPVRVGGRVLAIVVVTVLALGLLVFSNMQQRQRAAVASSVASERASTIAALGSGLVIDDVTMVGGASGVVVSDGDRIGWSLSGLPHATADEWLVAWLVTDGVATQAAVVGPGEQPPGAMAGSVTDHEAAELLVTITPVDSLVPTVARGEDPPGDVSVTADLSLVRAGNGGADD